jgi:hypothetical protein
MRAFYEQIAAKIATDLPKYKTVNLYNSQEDLTDDLQLYPAVSIEFLFTETIQLALGIKDMVMTVRFRFIYENYTRGSRLDDLDLMTEFTTFFDLYKGIETDPLQFTQFNETLRGLDTDHDNLAFPFIDYDTVYRNQENFTRSGQIVVAPVVPDTGGEII